MSNKKLLPCESTSCHPDGSECCKTCKESKKEVIGIFTMMAEDREESEQILRNLTVADRLESEINDELTDGQISFGLSNPVNREKEYPAGYAAQMNISLLSKRELEVLFLLVEAGVESIDTGVKADFSNLEDSDKETIKKLYDKLS